MGRVGSGEPVSELQLIEWCQARIPGWEAALAHWLMVSSGWLHQRCTAKLGCASKADDAVQEVSIKVMLAIEQFKGRCTLRTWVIRIADNHCNTVIQRECANLITQHLQYSIILVEQSRSRSDAEVQRCEETAREVVAALHSLTQQNQEILQLRFYSELSLDEMATSLSLSLSATKMRLYRALGMFKSVYAKNQRE